MKKFFKRMAIVLAVIFLAIQVVRPVRTNPPVPRGRSIHSLMQVPPNVAEIFDRSCRDCHSSDTRWPWYSNVAPVSWFLIDDVNHGREHMDLSDWADYDNVQQQAMLEDICKQTSKGAMPIGSYLLMHREAKLSAAEVRTLCEWSEAERGKLAKK